MIELSYTTAEMLGGPLDGEAREVLFLDGADGPRFGVLTMAPLVPGPGRSLRYRYSKGWPGGVVFKFEGYE